ncbi:MAG: hypothetical protein ACTH7W_06490 [Psychrobacter sp.]|uniref:hypothetical protein n=1 Tax=unclassified Psychrobacter TaxID=196806 RepID=UPI0017880A14|nr:MULTISPECIES: hypothetical protein [unclassified Psychrobacter]MBE0442873.1 hypothetical protein [Psychrobacter sp. FME13]
MDTQQASFSLWQKMIQQCFLSLYELPKDKITDPQKFQGYDFVFEFSDATIYFLVNTVVRQANKKEVDSAKVREWRKEVVNELIKRHAQVYHKNDKLVAARSTSIADKKTYFIGLTSLSISHQDEQSGLSSYAVGYEYGSRFFAEDCVLDLDNEQSVLQVFSYQNFADILSQLVTPSDLTTFLDFHRDQLASFSSFKNESTLLKQFLQSPDFHQRAIDVQERLIDNELIDQIELRLRKVSEPNQTVFANALMAEIQKYTRMWYKLFNSVIERYHKAGKPLPRAQIDVLADESMYTYACLVEKILAYRTMDQDSRWNGYVRHEHSYHVFGRHYLIVFYAQDDSSSLSAGDVRSSHQDLLSDLNAQLQDPVMSDLFLLGVEFRPCEDSVNTEVYLDIFHQTGTLIDENTQRLYERLAKLQAQL